MPIAKEDLIDGFTVVARKGTYVSSSAVERFGWQDKVEAGEDPDPAKDDARPVPPPQSQVPPQAK